MVCMYCTLSIFILFNVPPKSANWVLICNCHISKLFYVCSSACALIHCYKCQFIPSFLATRSWPSRCYSRWITFTPVASYTESPGCNCYAVVASKQVGVQLGNKKLKAIGCISAFCLPTPADTPDLKPWIDCLTVVPKAQQLRTSNQEIGFTRQMVRPSSSSISVSAWKASCF